MTTQVLIEQCMKSKILRKGVKVHYALSWRAWKLVPVSWRSSSPGMAFGNHIQMLVRLRDPRKQSFGTFFLRNRPELELMLRLLDQKPVGSKLDLAVVGCSKGAEVYSIVYTLRSGRPDLRLNLRAVDISPDILEFAAAGVYSCDNADELSAPAQEGTTARNHASWTTHRDQSGSIFERVTDSEMAAMFEFENGRAKIRPWLKEGITWLRGDACGRELLSLLGPQDMVVANRFLCHMAPPAAEACLRSFARLVKAGGYLFVCGVDLDVRTKVAREMGWKPVMDLLREVHEGDTSLTRDWPLKYWGLEPFCDDRRDWKLRYASVFQIPQGSRLDDVVEAGQHFN